MPKGMGMPPEQKIQPTDTKDPRVASLPEDPEEALTEKDWDELSEVLSDNARTRREAEAKSGDLRVG